MGISDDEMEAAIRRAEGIAFPIPQRELKGRPTSLLDFGCGWGRFTGDLTKLTGATDVVGYDPCAELVAMAPGGVADVRFVGGASRMFFSDFNAAFDLIWIHAVLGGIRDADLPEIAAALVAVLATCGLLFLMEDTLPLDPE